VKRIAFLGRGGHTLPSHRALLNKLAEEFAIILYSEVQIQPELLKLAHHYEIKCFKGMGLPKFLREPIFVFMLMIEHLKKPFDLIHSHSSYPTGLAAILLQKIFKVPALVSLDGGEGIFISQAKFGDFNSRKRTLLNKWVVNQAKGITTLTNFQKDMVTLNLDLNRKIEVITRGVDSKKFEFIENKIFGAPIIFLSIGYLSPIKNPEMLIKTFYLLQLKIDCLLIHIGFDYMKGEIQRKANEMGIINKVSFMDAVDYTQIQDYYKRADFLLHTSYYESEAMVVAEAMASGVIVCGTNVGLMHDLSGTCCVTTPSNNAELLASAVLELLENTERVKSLRKNARIWSEDNTLDSSSKKLSKMYDTLMAS
jgi:glycosyltransferase involved in cell wall biosynthesis